LNGLKTNKAYSKLDKQGRLIAVNKSVQVSDAEIENVLEQTFPSVVQQQVDMSEQLSCVPEEEQLVETEETSLVVVEQASEIDVKSSNVVTDHDQQQATVDANEVTLKDSNVDVGQQVFDDIIIVKDKRQLKKKREPKK